MYTHTVGFWPTAINGEKKKILKITIMFALQFASVNLRNDKTIIDCLFIIYLNHLSYDDGEGHIQCF